MNAAAQNMLEQGLACQQAGRLADAEKIFRTVLVQQPDDPNANRLLGDLLQRAGRANEAIGFYQRALTADPACLDIHLNMAGAFLAQGRADAAVPQWHC